MMEGDPWALEDLPAAQSSSRRSTARSCSCTPATDICSRTAAWPTTTSRRQTQLKERVSSSCTGSTLPGRLAVVFSCQWRAAEEGNRASLPGASTSPRRPDLAGAHRAAARPGALAGGAALVDVRRLDDPAVSLPAHSVSLLTSSRSTSASSARRADRPRLRLTARGDERPCGALAEGSRLRGVRRPRRRGRARGRCP